MQSYIIFYRLKYFTYFFHKLTSSTTCKPTAFTLPTCGVGCRVISNLRIENKSMTMSQRVLATAIKYNNILSFSVLKYLYDYIVIITLYVYIGSTHEFSIFEFIYIFIVFYFRWPRRNIFRLYYYVHIIIYQIKIGT